LSDQEALRLLKQEISKCQLCAPYFDHKPRPVVAFDAKSKILIIGQAPGIRVHTSGIPWQDNSGDNLRSWLGIDKDAFYDRTKFAIVPMGFCYPGKGKSGDLPPRKECAPKWHEMILSVLKGVKLTLLIGQYAQSCYLKGDAEKTLTQTVKNFERYLPNFFVLPHPSPRNNIWMKKNPWFQDKVLPQLKKHVKGALKS